MFVIVATMSFKASLSNFERDLLAFLTYCFQVLAAIALALFIFLPDAHAALDVQAIGAAVLGNQSPIEIIGNMLFSLSGSVLVVVIVLKTLSRSSSIIRGISGGVPGKAPNRAFTDSRPYTSTPSARYGRAYSRQAYNNHVYDELMNRAQFIEYRARLAELEKDYWHWHQHGTEYSDYDPVAIQESYDKAALYLAQCEEEAEQIEQQIQEMKKAQAFEEDEEDDDIPVLTDVVEDGEQLECSICWESIAELHEGQKICLPCHKEQVRLGLISPGASDRTCRDCGFLDDELDEYGLCHYCHEENALAQA